MIAQENAMRPLNSHFPHGALPTLDTFRKHSKEARVFRRAQAVREVVTGQTVKAVSATFHFTNSALRKWVKRFAREGTDGLLDRPRSGRPAKMTGEIKTQLNRQPTRRSRPPPAWFAPFAVELSRTRHGAEPAKWDATRS